MARVVSGSCASRLPNLSGPASDSTLEAQHPPPMPNGKLPTSFVGTEKLTPKSVSG